MVNNSDNKDNKDNVAYRWLQLSVMLGAGITPATAVKTLTKKHHKSNTALLRAASLLERGLSMTEALKQTKQLSKHDLAILNNAEKAGRTAQGLDYIARDQMTRWRHRHSLETAFLLPKAILFIGAIAALFIQTLQGHGSLIPTIVWIATVTTAVLLATKLFVVLWSLNARIWLSFLWPFRHFTQQNSWFQNHFEHNFFRNLRWQLQSGVSADKAIQRCTDLIKHSHYRQQINTAIHAVKEGQPLPTSLLQAKLILSNRMRQTLLTANEVGVFDKSLEIELNWLQHKINTRAEEQIKWLPKIYYFVILAVVFTYFL